MANMDQLQKDLALVEKNTQEIAKKLSEEQVNRYVIEIANEMRGQVRAMIMTNFDAAKIEDRTGKLREAISNCMFGIFIKDSKPLMKISLPRRVEDYTDKSGEQHNFYMVASAINYGAVHGKGNKKLKAAIKKTGKTGDVGGGLTILAAHKIFYLSDSQKQQLGDIFITKLNQKINGKDV